MFAKTNKDKTLGYDTLKSSNIKMDLNCLSSSLGCRATKRVFLLRHQMSFTSSFAYHLVMLGVHKLFFNHFIRCKVSEGLQNSRHFII